jgi:transcriptional regulator with XRE-family HTH domain
MGDKLTKSVTTALEKARIERGMSIREVAGAIGTSISQAQRILGKDKGSGSISLRAVATAAEVLGVEVSLILTDIDDDDLRMVAGHWREQAENARDELYAAQDETEGWQAGQAKMGEERNRYRGQRDKARELLREVRTLAHKRHNPEFHPPGIPEDECSGQICDLITKHFEEVDRG